MPEVPHWDKHLPTTDEEGGASPQSTESIVSGWAPPHNLDSPRADIDFDASRPSRTYIYDSVSGHRQLSTDVTVAGIQPPQNAASDTPSAPETLQEVSSSTEAMTPMHSDPSLASSGTTEFSSQSGVIPGTGRKGEPGHVPRPPNKWMLFRQHHVRNRGPSSRQTREALLQELKTKWATRTPEEDAYWASMAKERKQHLYQQYPFYAYHPRPRGSGRSYGGAQATRNRSMTLQTTEAHSSLPSRPNPGPHASTVTPSDPHHLIQKMNEKKKRRSSSVPDCRVSAFSSFNQQNSSLPPTQATTWEPTLLSEGWAESRSGYIAPVPFTVPLENPSLSMPFNGRAMSIQTPIVSSPFEAVHQIVQQDPAAFLRNSPDAPVPQQALIPPTLYAPLPNRQNTESSISGTLSTTNGSPPLPRILTTVQQSYMPHCSDGFPQSAPPQHHVAHGSVPQSDMHGFNLGLSRGTGFFDFFSASSVPREDLSDAQNSDFNDEYPVDEEDPSWYYQYDSSTGWHPGPQPGSSKGS